MIPARPESKVHHKNALSRPVGFLALVKSLTLKSFQGLEAPYKMSRHSYMIWTWTIWLKTFWPSCCLLNSLIVGWVARLIQKRKAGPQFWSWLDEETCVDNPSGGAVEQATKPSNKVKSCQQLLCSACAWALPAMCQQSFFLQHNKAGNLWLETETFKQARLFWRSMLRFGESTFLQQNWLSSPTQKYLAISSSAYKIGDQIKAMPGGTKWGKDLVTKSKLPQCSPPCL